MFQDPEGKHFVSNLKMHKSCIACEPKLQAISWPQSLCLENDSTPLTDLVCVEICATGADWVLHGSMPGIYISNRQFCTYCKYHILMFYLKINIFYEYRKSAKATLRCHILKFMDPRLCSSFLQISKMTYFAINMTNQLNLNCYFLRFI